MTRLGNSRAIAGRLRAAGTTFHTHSLCMVVKQGPGSRRAGHGVSSGKWRLSLLSYLYYKTCRAHPPHLPPRLSHCNRHQTCHPRLPGLSPAPNLPLALSCVLPRTKHTSPAPLQRTYLPLSPGFSPAPNLRPILARTKRTSHLRAAICPELSSRPLPASPPARTCLPPFPGFSPTQNLPPPLPTSPQHQNYLRSSRPTKLTRTLPLHCGPNMSPLPS